MDVMEGPRGKSENVSLILHNEQRITTHSALHDIIYIVSCACKCEVSIVIIMHQLQLTVA